MLQPVHKRQALCTFMRATLIGFTFCVSYALNAPRLLAHHAFSAEFDAKQPTTFEGVVTKVDWTNPHVYFYATVKEKAGRTATWAFEIAGPNSLTRLGWDRHSLKAGDRVTVVGYPARDGAKVASARSILLANGRKVFAGTPLDGGPQP